MNYENLVDYVVRDTSVSVRLFLPELVLIGTILVMLLLRVSDTTRRLIPTWLLALAGATAALAVSAPWIFLNQPRSEIFTGMLIYDPFTVFFRSLLVFFTILFVLLTRISGLADEEDAADFYTLVLGAVVGMCLMASANHLLIVFLAVEMASVPSYVLAGMLKRRRQSSEAALKYAVYGAGAAGVMLYGISLIAGLTGSAHLPTIAERLAAGVGGEAPLVLLLGGLMILVGLAFKLSAVPFHFWCPDVFEGASAEVNAFLSVASKAAALALLVRVAVGLSYVPAEPPRQEARQASPAEMQVVSLQAGPGVVEQQGRLVKMRALISTIVAILAAVTCTFGNLAAYGQTNIKRLLAYSTIAHAGYMMMPVAAGISLLSSDPLASQRAFASLLVYAGIYVFMNLGAFAIVAFLRNAMSSEEISDYAGLVSRSPGVVVCLSAILFSLVGLPPLAGFLGKLVIFAGLVDAGMYTLLMIGGVNTALSLFYYLRVVKVMTMDAEPDQRGPVSFSMLSVAGMYVAVVTAPVLFLIVQWDGLNQWALAACQHLFG
ncbi:MAG: NADH-quinone oxidoreductase subunit N [Planctomycetales bacterium]|nr:NADH-quinone oxidoreductase subunit N [Planctomycetales bacterium]